MQRYKRPGAEAAWHFLTPGDAASIERLTRAAGFRYVWDEQTQQFAHPSGVIVLTPDGRLARYLFGIEYSPRDLRLGLVEASAGKVGSPVDALLLYCFHYDPMTGRYGLVIMRAIRLAGAATVLALGSFIIVMLRRERRAAPAAAPAAWTRSMGPAPALPRQRLDDGVPRRCAVFLPPGDHRLLLAAHRGLIVFYAVKYRRRSPEAVGVRIHGGLMLELGVDGDPVRSSRW